MLQVKNFACGIGYSDAWYQQVNESRNEVVSIFLARPARRKFSVRGGVRGGLIMPAAGWWVMMSSPTDFVSSHSELLYFAALISKFFPPKIMRNNQ